MLSLNSSSGMISDSAAMESGMLSLTTFLILGAAEISILVPLVGNKLSLQGGSRRQKKTDPCK